MDKIDKKEDKDKAPEKKPKKEAKKAAGKPKKEAKKDKGSAKLESKIVALEASLEEAKQTIEDQKAGVQEANDKALRTLAEFENFKKRKEQEKDDAIKFSLKTFFEEMLPMLDSFNQAEATFSKLSEENKAVKEGFDLIRKQLYNLLEKQGVTKIEALDQVFDPNLHQAVMQETREGVESNRVLEVMQEGYLYHERVLRAAMVLVSN